MKEWIDAYTRNYKEWLTILDRRDEIEETLYSKHRVDLSDGQLDRAWQDLVASLRIAAKELFGNKR